MIFNPKSDPTQKLDAKAKKIGLNPKKSNPTCPTGRHGQPDPTQHYAQVGCGSCQTTHDPTLTQLEPNSTFEEV
jgi:hypothetical protein